MPPTPTTLAAALSSYGLHAAAAALAEPMPVVFAYPCGTRLRCEDTPWAPLADALRTVAQEGEDAVFEWCEPVHRPAVEDVEALPGGGLLLHFADLSEAADEAADD